MCKLCKIHTVIRACVASWGHANMLPAAAKDGRERLRACKDVRHVEGSATRGTDLGRRRTGERQHPCLPAVAVAWGAAIRQRPPVQPTGQVVHA